jgi:phosphoglycolate phosphatase
VVNFRAVLFDLDGTLLNTLDDIANSMNSVLTHLGFPTHPVETYKYFVGDGMEKLAYRSLPQTQRDEDVVARCVIAMREEYSKRYAERTRPYEGIAELLDSLAHRSVVMAILSNKPDDYTKKIVSRFLHHWQFDIVIGARPFVPKKPDPVAALEIAEKLAIPPEAFLYAGDTGTDMQTALAAGMYPAGVLWGFRGSEELIAGGAKVLVEKPLDLLKLF